jgi:tetratricopeptide (TPR) repeat protein
VVQPGDAIAGRFELERLAGRGGMGTVWRARDRSAGGWVALKLLDRSERANAERFAREASTLASLDHPAIVRYVAHGAEPDGVRWLAMEWLEGHDLRERLRHGPLGVADAVSLARRAAQGLAAAHARGVLHRDVKPGNLMLVGGDARDARVLDFGLARARWDSGEPSPLTRTGATIGTPRYMAPEQARGARVVGPAADVFSLGCVLYECLTGEPAFAGEEPIAALAKILLEETPRVSDRLPGVPAALDDLVARMTSKDPSDRPADAAAVLREIDSVELDAAPASSAPASVSSAPRTLTSSERRLLSVLLVRPASAREAGSAPTLAADDRTIADAHAGLRARLRAAADAHGARADVLLDGTFVVTLDGMGMATDRAAAAARCALALHEADPEAPIALATGRVAMDRRLPVGEAIERAAHLVAVETAARARAGAEGPSAGVRIDDVTAGLIETSFDLARGDSAAGSASDRAEASEPELRLIGERPRNEAVRTLLGKVTPCVGRDRELRTLSDLVDECVGESVARAVVVTAPAGAGKSRLRHEWLARVRAQSGGARVWFGRGEAAGAGSPLVIVAHMLRDTAGTSVGDPDEDARRKLVARVRQHVPAADVARVAEFLGEVVHVPFPDGESEPLRAARGDARLMADQMLRAWLDFVDAELGAGPLLLVLEDLQWGDAATVRYVDAALRNFRDRPLMVLAIARPEIDDLFPRLWEERGAQTIALGPLGRRACETLARAVLGEAAEDAVVARLLDRAGGHALLLEELLRAEVEGRGAQIPETVLAIVQARIEAMPEQARRLLRAASVFGTTFWRGGVLALTGQPGGSQEIDAWLEVLLQREVATAQPRSRFPGDAEYRFRQVVVRDAAYAMLLDKDRVLGHRLAAQWLESAGERDAVAIAGHYEQGAEPERAARAWTTAADAAAAADDGPAVIARVGRAVACGAEGTMLGHLRLLEAEAAWWQTTFEASGRSAAAAVELLPAGSPDWYTAAACLARVRQQLGDRDGLAEVARRLGTVLPAPGAHSSRARSLARLASTLVDSGRSDEARALLDQAETEARASPLDRSASGALHQALAQHAASLGQHDRALRNYESAQAEFERAGDAKRRVLMLLNQGGTLTDIGRYAEAEQVLRRGLDAARRAGVPGAEAAATANLAHSLGRLGRFAEAIAAGSRARDFLAGLGDRRLAAFAHAYLADILHRSGDLPAAEEQARASLEAASAHGPERCVALGAMAGIRLARGDARGALDAAQEGLAVARALGGVAEGEMYLRLVQVNALSATGDDEGARAALRDAVVRLESLAASMDDRSLRRSLLENVDEHARLLALARESSGRGRSA